MALFLWKENVLIDETYYIHIVVDIITVVHDSSRSAERVCATGSIPFYIPGLY